jgi:hypothetical protein
MSIRGTELEDRLKSYSLYTLPIEVHLLQNEEEFRKILDSFMKRYSMAE